MKKINVINVSFAERTGIQPLYETLDEMLSIVPDMDEYEKDDHQDSIDNWKPVGFVKCDGTQHFIFVDEEMDDYVIIET